MTAWYAALPERDTSLSATWSTDEFRERLRAWCAAYVGPITAMRQQKLRGWATVWRVGRPTGCGSPSRTARASRSSCR